MELSDYTNDELKAELKRRAEAIRIAKSAVPRCRNCAYYERDNRWLVDRGYCLATTFVMKKVKRHYIKAGCNKACMLYEPRTDNTNN